MRGPMNNTQAHVATVPGLRPVGRASLQQRVYDELTTSLMHGAFAAGQVLRM